MAGLGCRVIANGHDFADRDDLLGHLIRACSDPIFHKRSRRGREPVEPASLPFNVVLYRSDGAARGQGQVENIRSGAGAVFFGGDSTAQAWRSICLGNVSNNVAEYVGALLVLERVARLLHTHSVLQMDSMLVTNQLCGRWRVANADLVPYFRRASALLQHIRQNGSRIDFRHVYREFNKDADAQANLGADGIDAQHDW